MEKSARAFKEKKNSLLKDFFEGSRIFKNKKT
jgi:hypothetical protein